MASRKKGSELVFNLQWRNKPDNGGDKSNVIGMYDTPATTLNFETFKSYLLKNSGVVGNDVKVTFLTDDGTQWLIDSQEGFEIALCAFRLKARLGEVIFLKLDKVNNSASHQMARKHSNDVETQFDDTIINLEGPPEWFLNYMTQFKRDVVEEVTDAVNSNLIANSKDKEAAAPVVVFPKKVKPECSKRSRKHMVLGENPVDKELLKTLKYDRKIEIKLDKLDAKTKKIKEKKQALINKIDTEEHHRHTQKFRNLVDVDGNPLMNATLVSESTVLPRMVGGETYLHTWEVTNNGKLPWTSKTELRLTWGSADMKPSSNVIRCPPLHPGERGLVCVRFEIPKKPGLYESYWNFFEGEVRFGHWVSCRVIVDEPVSCVQENVSYKKAKIEQENVPLTTQTVNTPEKSNSPKYCVPQEDFLIFQGNPSEPRLDNAAALNADLINISRKMHDMNVTGETQVDSDSDWESLGSCAASRKPKSAEEKAVDDFDPLKTNKYGINEKDLIVDLSKTKESKSPSARQSPIEDVKKDTVEKEAEMQAEEVTNSNDDNNNNGSSVNNNSSEESIEIGSDVSDVSSGYDVISGAMCDEGEEASGYVYITVDGNKLPVPKHIIRPDFLEKVEEAPVPVSLENDEKTVAENPTVPTEESGQTAPHMVYVGKVNHLKPEQLTEYTKSFIRTVRTPCVEASFANAKPGQHTRVFIFPQDNPGFEVLYYPKGLGDGTVSETTECPWQKVSFFPNGVGDLNENENKVAVNAETSQQAEKSVENTPPRGGTPRTSVLVEPTYVEANTQRENFSCPTNTTEAMPTDLASNYTWARSDTQYTFPDLETACAAHLKCDPYGPLDQSRPMSAQDNATNPTPKFQHIPNYQQSTPPKKATVQGQKFRYVPVYEPTSSSDRLSYKPQTPSAPPQTQRPPSEYSQSTPVHILPENLVSGAVNVASSAINTARSVISMIVPPKTEPGKWVNGHWVTENPQSKRAENLCILADMGFWDTDLNATLLARYNDDISRVVSELLQ